ncbi:MAG: ABC transporter permease [Actinomycetota bacterium]
MGARDRGTGDRMNTFTQVFHWLTTAAHWHGPDGIPIRMMQHVGISFAAVAGAIAIAVPVGMLVGHKRRGEFLAVSIANIGRAVPSFAVLVLVFVVMLRFTPGIAFGNGPGFVALALLAIPPIITNTYVGIQAVDADTVEAARGMGMRERQVLLRIELPLATPLILAGVRTAAVTVVATAALIALIGGGTLGRYIIDGFARGDTVMTVAGAVLVAIVAILTEVIMAVLQRAMSPKQASKVTRAQRARLTDEGVLPPQLGPLGGM